MSKVALDKLKSKFGASVLAVDNFRGDETAVVKGAQIKQVCTFLRDEKALAFDMLTDATAVDYLLDPAAEDYRFEVVYHFYSTTLKHRLRVKVRLPEEEPQVDSIHELWPVANWLEREIWDMYGIRFVGHPELRRILLYEEFEGHPLRKDYPKDKHQPLARRPENEIAECMERRGKISSLLPEEV